MLAHTFFFDNIFLNEYVSKTSTNMSQKQQYNIIVFTNFPRAMERTKIFLTKKFDQFYQENLPKMPPHYQKREWAFVPLESIPKFVMFRHMAFKTVEEIKGYFSIHVPANVYYSTAYYGSPDSEKMEDKGWEGADLVFDIDADHLPIRNKALSNALKHAKEEIIMLSEILGDDFGVKKSEMKIVFSGGRGYHLHVHSEDFTKLDSSERREIIDYLMLNDLKFEYKIPQTSQGRRIAECMSELSDYILKESMDELNSLLKRYEYTGKKQNILQALSSGNFNRLSRSKVGKKLFETLFNKCSTKVKVNIDAPVTADIKRLIRLPGSLHGKTGFKALEVPHNTIVDFDPLADARVFGEEKVKIRVRRVSKEELSWALHELGGRYPKIGDKIEVPEYLAVFLLCRGMALYGY